MEVAVNADEIINGPTPGNHFQVISSATELLRVIFFSLAQPENLGGSLPRHCWVVFGEGTLRSSSTWAPGYTTQSLIKPSPGLDT